MLFRLVFVVLQSSLAFAGALMIAGTSSVSYYFNFIDDDAKSEVLLSISHYDNFEAF